MPHRFGASPEEWSNFKKLAKRDLLPVVSNPHAEISPRSRMKGKGKTPSVYNHAQQVIGFADWTDHEATVRNIEAWADEPDFGICVQTRLVRAFDCDVPDAKLSGQIVDAWLDALGVDALPTRFRKDSGKQLLAFKLEGEFSKRSFVVKEWQERDEAKGKDITKRWIIEFLAEGQQFVAVGQHTDGARYEWDGGLPAEFPTISAKAFERAWQAVVDEFAIAGTDRRTERRDPTLPEDLDVADPVAEHLIEAWDTYGIHKGMLYIECPWAENHSSDNGETQTAWLLAGTGKYRNGHFACRHAGCSGHTDADFFNAVGYKLSKAEDFEDLTQADDLAEVYAKLAPGASPKSKELKAEARVVRQAERLPLPGFNRDKQGRIETSLENLYRALNAPQASECEIAFDEFRGELMLAETPDAWRSFEDADAVELRARLEALGFKDKIGKELMRDALEWVGRDRRFDSARKWLLDVVPPWDGVSRIARFWPDYMQTEDSPYTRAMGDYSWTAQAGRVLEPGCQVDMVPVLVGAEGLRKTSALKMIGPALDFYGEFNLSKDDADLARIMRGKLVGELAELRGISVRDGEAILAWITRAEEEWTPKFKEYATKLARRLVFYGTTNDPEFLQPHMGQRRWLPVEVMALIDTAKIAQDRLKLWAEARDVFLCEGVLYEEAERLAKGERDSFQHVDAWHDRAETWLHQSLDVDETLTPFNCGTLTSEQVLRECLGFDAGRTKKAEQMRIGEVLKACGMVRIQRKVGGRNKKVWVAAKDQRG
jgi:predicted P-loop ATPase